MVADKTCSPLILPGGHCSWEQLWPALSGMTQLVWQ